MGLNFHIGTAPAPTRDDGYIDDGFDELAGAEPAAAEPADADDWSRRAAAKLGRAELLANFFGGAVWGVFRENANCGDPPGTLPVPSRYPPGTLYISPGPNLENPAKIRQKSGKNPAKIRQNLGKI